MVPFEYQRDRGYKLNSVHTLSLSKIHRGKRFWLLVLMFYVGFLLPVHLLSQSSNSGETQSPSMWDCSDPLLANTQDCSSQTQQGFTSLSSSPVRSSLAGESGTQSGFSNRNYSDIEQFSRQASKLNQPPEPPEPPTEFQKFIASTSGQNLHIYGARLFSSVPSTFAPLDMTPVPHDYIIGPGDELRIRVWGQVNFQSNVRVDRSGEIFLPQIGPVHVAGLSFSALNAHLRGAVGRVYRNFNLTADMGQIRSIQVYVSGQARRPGVYTVSSLSTLVDALFASGGPSTQGSMRRIQLLRGSAVVTVFDLYDLLIRGNKSRDVKLQSGDVIFIPPVGSQVAITGSVRNPAIYELQGHESLAGLLADAGGVSSIVSEARVSIERIENHRDRHAMEVAYDENGLSTPLADGDWVRVYSIVPVYRKTVTLRGNVANPGRFAWHPGMHVSDLIPDRESLITRNYWWKRAQLGLPVPEGADAASQLGLQQNQDQNQNQDQKSNQNQNLKQNQNSNQNQNLPQNQITNLSAQQHAGSASLATIQTPSAARAVPPLQQAMIGQLAPEIDWNYAVIERLDPEALKMTLIPFDLGRLVLQHDASQDLELQSGDVVSILSEADIRVPLAQQTKVVRLEGEFAHAGVYTVQPGETFRHLVERAGGFTSNAYLYGSEFTRESTRAVQQLRIDEYVQSLSMGLQRSSLALASSSASTAQDVASSAAAQGSEQKLLASLRQIHATGRIVLRFAPDSSGISSLPEITLEDGDRFVVPSVPSTVNVIGAVYDQNSFLYTQGNKAGAYLQIAGGPNRDADRKHAFIIRANGEVISRERSKTIWGGDTFNNLRINPGDTIVVPEKTFKPSALRGVLDWSQMFSQFALGAAALSVID
jgi:protein involved in polysaccharide export with SLBB domain